MSTTASFPTGVAKPLPPDDHRKLVARMRDIVGNDNVLTAAADMAVYECDGFTIAKTKPNVVVFPTTTEHIVGIVKACAELDVKFLARGAGTSLAGGCVLVGGGVMIALARMKRILEVNVRDRYAVVEPGVVNVWLTNALKPHGYHYAPDPSSQGACTVGGNVATNSGGPHTLKYGVTVNHVLGVEIVLPDGSVVQTGGPGEDVPGYDLTGVIVGSEGTFGVVVIMEVDGLEAGLDADAKRITQIAKENGAREVRRAATDAERDLLWKSRKKAFGAVGRLAPSYCTQDGVVPRTKLPHILRVIQRISEKYTIRIANVFHAGDGNIHPILLFDERDPDQVKRVLAASHEILEEGVRCGGSVTGENGIGVERVDLMPRLFRPEDLPMMQRLRAAFNPR